MFCFWKNKEIKELEGTVRFLEDVAKRKKESHDFRKDTIDLYEQMMFYVGDYFHNFGNETWFNPGEEEKERKPLVLSPEATDRIANSFMTLRLVSGNGNRFEMYHLVRQIEEVSTFSDTMKEELKQYANDLSSDNLELKKLSFRLIILEFKKLLPETTGGNYSFKDSDPQTLDAFLNQTYTIK